MQSTDSSFENIRKDFPILSRTVRDNKPLVYLDNASTTQKPNQVIDAITDYYRNHNANIHRAVYALAEESTEAYESARDKIAKFVNIKNRQELIFVRGTTEAINLVAYAWGRPHINEGDIIVTTEYEHHSNIVPWQLLTQEKRAKLEYIGMNDDGQLNLDDLDKYLATGKVKLVTFSLMSNVLGTITDAEKIISKCKAAGVPTLIDGAQAVPHMKVDLETLGCDFFAFSGHKMLAPTGIGVLWVRKSVLQTMNPFHGGGDMIREVHKYETTWNDLPYKFEAGTPNIADAIGLGAAIDYLTNIGMDNIHRRESELLKYGTEKLSQIPGVRFIGTASDKIGVLSFIMEGTTPDEIGKELDREGIAVRTGHHCAQPILRNFGLESTVRPSFAFYNLKSEIDKMTDVLFRIRGLHPV